MKVAICGVRHGHIASIARDIREHPELELVAVSEPDPAACAKLIAAADLRVTHASLEDLLANADFDLLAIGQAYKERGPTAIAALKAGKHVVSDKPLCITTAELDAIEALVKESGLACMIHLTLRYQATWHAARAALRAGRIGNLLTVSVFGRHPLNYRGGRPDWYFEEGMHGGTLNDLGVHGLDGLEWLTGIPLAEVVAARAWNQNLDAVPFFQTGAQAMLRMANGAGVILDASYSTPPGHGDPWTLRFYGSEGDLRLTTGHEVVLRRAQEPPCELVPADTHGARLIDDLVAEVGGSQAPRLLTTRDSLRATRLALLTQQAADDDRMHVAL